MGMNNHLYTIIIICNSDIILKGLAEILTGCNSNEVILLHQSNELVDYPYLSGYLLIILPLKLDEKNEMFFKRVFSAATEIKYLHIDPEIQSEPSRNRINLYDSHSLVVSKVNELLNAFGSKGEEKTLNELTRRETDVLRLVSRGLSNKEIADKLSISIHTVISHRKNITEKTGIKSASGLTMYAVLKKIIDIDEISTSDLI
jgi:DNA-binding CsgD family transcriptional regulator